MSKTDDLNGEDVVVAKDQKAKVNDLEAEIKELKAQLREQRKEFKDVCAAVSRAVPRNGNVNRLIKRYL